MTLQNERIEDCAYNIRTQLFHHSANAILLDPLCFSQDNDIIYSLLSLFICLLFFLALSQKKCNKKLKVHTCINVAFKLGDPMSPPQKSKKTFWNIYGKNKTKSHENTSVFLAFGALKHPQIYSLYKVFNPNIQVLIYGLFWGLGNSYKPCGMFAPISWPYIVAWSTHQTYMVRLRLDGTK